jgi:prefoldin subunit 5
MKTKKEITSLKQKIKSLEQTIKQLEEIISQLNNCLTYMSIVPTKEQMEKAGMIKYIGKKA